MPSGSSYKPDDIIRAYNGKTIEIDNTDAEGRVTMADILSFASVLSPSYILDVATPVSYTHLDVYKRQPSRDEIWPKF